MQRAALAGGVRRSAPADERYVNRRQFAKFLALTSLGMFAGNLWILVAHAGCTGEPSYPGQAGGAARRTSRWAA